MQLTKMSTGMTPSKRKKTVPLSCVLDMIENSPSKRPRLCEPERDNTVKKSPVKPASARKCINKASSDDEENPTFQIRSFYNPSKSSYLSPIQRKNSGLVKPVVALNVSRSAGPKLKSSKRIKRKKGATPRAVKKLDVSLKKKTLPLHETKHNAISTENTSNAQVTKNELTFKINVKSSTPISSPINCKTNGLYDFDEPLTWDVDKLTPNSEKKFFKHRPSPGQNEKRRSESGTSLVVKQGFKLKFVHHRGEKPLSDSTGATTPKAKPAFSKLNKTASTKSPKTSSSVDDAMMKKLRDELMREAENEDTFAFVSSSDESVHQITENAPNNDVRDEMTPDLFSQSSYGTAVLESATVAKVTPPSSDSACHVEETGSTSDPDTPQLSRSSSPSISVVSSEDSIVSGPSRRLRILNSDDKQKYFPIFTRGSTPKRTRSKIFKCTDSPKSIQSPLVSKHSKGNLQQMYILKIEIIFYGSGFGYTTTDAGQTVIGATQCETCGMVYTVGESADETTHGKFHQHVISALKFPGWKKERVLQEYPEDGGRILLVQPDDPKYALKKVEDINEIMAEELGFSQTTISFQPSYKVFLYISDDRKVVGCCVAEPISQGYRVIPEKSQDDNSQRPWCCDTKPSPAVVGVSRIWVYRQNRREGIASRLLEAVRCWFEYGSLIDKTLVAFSDPTPDGRQLGAKYTGREDFLVYKYNMDTL